MKTPCLLTVAYHSDENTVSLGCGISLFLFFSSVITQNILECSGKTPSMVNVANSTANTLTVDLYENVRIMPFCDESVGMELVC